MKLCENTPAVRSERSRASGEVEEQATSGSGSLRLRCATLRPNGKDSTASEEVYESSVVRFSIQSLESRVKEAEECFLKAIEIAQRQQAKSLELRAATSLARLWLQQGKRTEAHKLLSEVYNWFTEGFDTKDLQEAKALLEELIA